MIDLEDKILGSWLGMAVGDAMGQSVKGLKPETVKQYFKRVDGYKDVRPYIGKGIKRFRMPGLYGAPTQMALAVADVLLKTKKPDGGKICHQLLELSLHGPENYFGVYRRPEGCFYKNLQTLPHRSDPLIADTATAFGTYAVMAVPLALHQRPQGLLKVCSATALLMSRHPWEIIGTVLLGFLVAEFLTCEPPGEEETSGAPRDLILRAAKFCQEAEDALQAGHPELRGEAERDANAMSKTFTDLHQNYADFPQASQWIAANASSYSKIEIVHATQGYILTLLPLAVLLMVDSPPNFSQVLTRTLNLGREADKLGAWVGAMAGAWHGLQSIPQDWQSGLVNGKEIRLRGQALERRRLHGKAKLLLEMELGLTQKEAEERRRFLPKETQKAPKKGASPEDLWEAEDPMAQLREDPQKKRQFERDKSRKKRDRRQHPGFLDEDE